MRSLQLVERGYWDAAVGRLVSPVTSPGAVSFQTLPYHWRCSIGCACVDSREPHRRGDFEDLETMKTRGLALHPISLPACRAPSIWRLMRPGRSMGLRLVRWRSIPKHRRPRWKPRPCCSPAAGAGRGRQLVCVHGWVQVPAPIVGSTDGLLIVDSLSGESLAERIGRTDGWRQFALYRVAPRSEAMCVTFALSEWRSPADDVAIEIVEGPPALSQR